MNYYDQWVDFIICPMNPDYVTNAEMRLDMRGSTNISDELMLVEPQERKFRVTKDLIFFEDDETTFETMCIDNYGKVMIWTVNKIWFLERSRELERLQYLPRHPLR